MLYSIEGEKIESIPHRQEYDWLMARMSSSDVSDIIDAIHAAIDASEIFNASFLPGSEWEGTPYIAIYEACDQDVERAGLMYGLLCWVAVQRHGDDWIGYPNTEKDTKAQKSLGRGWTYFRRKS